MQVQTVEQLIQSHARQVAREPAGEQLGSGFVDGDDTGVCVDDEYRIAPSLRSISGQEPSIRSGTRRALTQVSRAIGRR